MKLHKIRKLSVVSILLLALVMAVGPVQAIHLEELLEIDDPADATNDPVPPGDDWDDVYNGTDNSIQSTFIQDGSGNDDDIFQTGGSKDIQDVSEWQRTTGNVPDKDDILDAFAAAYTDPDTGDLIVFFGGDRLANNGDAQIGFWFFQDQVSPDGGNGFIGQHTIGDVLVLSNFVGGGSESNIQVYQWAGADGIGGYPMLLAEKTQEDAFRLCTDGDEACAATNSGGEPSPWPYDPKFGTTNVFPEVSLFEGAVNFTELLGDDVGCFSSFLAETRSSQSITAQLKDYALGAFSLCDMEVDKSGDTLSKAGDDVDYEITVTNTGAVRLYKQSIVDTLLGDLTGDASCGAFLDPGDSCTINVSRTVLDTDPDPLPNTVTAIYDSKADLLGDEISRSDDHSVNLFQPSIAFDKTGDTLSKAGDDVDYVLTLDNTSSADSPDLECTITDAMLGINKNVTLASGASDVTNATYTVLDTDPDPLVNTASVSCSPIGFPNVLPAGDSHTVNLFQPDYSLMCVATVAGVDVTGGDVFPGDLVSFEFTFDDQSSADTPTMDLASYDFAVGGVAQAFAPPDPLADTTVAFDHLVANGDPSPLVASLSTTYSPSGFPNQLERSAACEVFIKFGCALSPGFWGGGSGLSKWDQAQDPVAMAAGFTTNTPFPWVDASLFADDPTPGDGVITYLDILRLPAHGDVTRQLAFKYVAAELNLALATIPELNLASPPYLPGLLADIEAYFMSFPVGSDPHGQDARQGKLLHNAINDYFATVGEGKCPDPANIPEYTP